VLPNKVAAVRNPPRNNHSTRERYEAARKPLCLPSNTRPKAVTFGVKIDKQKRELKYGKV